MVCIRSSVVSVALMSMAALLLSCGEPVTCLGDADCPRGLYCQATVCVAPTGDGPLDDLYVERIMPLFEAGCGGCHGIAYASPDRPFTLDHTGGRPSESTKRDLSNWSHNPARDARERGLSVDAIDRPAIVGYAAGLLGFHHPTVWPLGSPQSEQIRLFAERVQSEWARPTGDGSPRPASAAPVALSGREAETRIRAAEIEAAETADTGSPLHGAFESFESPEIDLAARVMSQCGGCHDVTRVLRVLDPATRLSGYDRRGALQGMLCEIGLTFANQLPVALGLPIGDFAHPQVYSGPGDPRYQVLLQWFEHFRRTTQQALDAAGVSRLDEIRPCADEAAPIAVLPDSDTGAPDDMGPEDMPGAPADDAGIDPLDRYVQKIGPELHTACGDCHSPGEGRLWTHHWVEPMSDDDIEASIRHTGGFVDPDALLQSPILTKPDNTYHRDISGVAFEDRAGFIQWLTDAENAGLFSER